MCVYMLPQHDVNMLYLPLIPQSGVYNVEASYHHSIGGRQVCDQQ